MMPAEATDLDRFARPDDDPRRLAERRELLIDQLAWLMDEATALGPLLGDLPDWAVSQTALPGERSVRSALARIAQLDRGQRIDWVRAIAAGTHGDLSPEEPALDEAGVTDRTLPELLEGLRAERARFLDEVRGVAAETWTAPVSFGGEPATLYDVIMRIVRDDADELRALAYRLHDGGVGQRAM